MLKRILTTIFVAAFLVVFPACVNNQSRESRETPLTQLDDYQSILSVRGPEAVHQLTEWYRKTYRDCGNGGRPAFLCSGVMLRATETNSAFLPWDPSPGAQERGGTSFSWIRTDNNFKNLVFEYNNGYIIYPIFYVPTGKKSDIQILCAFPMDADTANRPTQQGCGPNTQWPAVSRACAEQGIATANQWIAHFNQPGNKYHVQCSWNTKEGVQDSADHFYQNILARNLMAAEWWDIQNEVMIETWKPGIGATLPIHSFFYRSGYPNSLTNAKNDQLRYFNAYKERIPIIQLILPNSKAEQARFVYSNADQAVDPASEEGFETLSAGDAGNRIRLRYFIVTSSRNLRIVAGQNKPPFLTGNALSSDDSDIEFSYWPQNVKFGYVSAANANIRIHTFDDKGAELCCITVAPNTNGAWVTDNIGSGRKIKKIRIEGPITLDNVSLIY
ncbi:hypothetical protein [Burkholderia ubonensis]|uniref:hypothetical protein n=1 Tax=Burkholderia ubonensis TaxID=101571 RepID=UPI000AE25091|nr:hypothetical protein [Burkholderia ubonensis]